ncbi:hypothetical protein REPUB_Repub06bG0047500 [Reevesia pubescens]
MGTIYLCEVCGYCLHESCLELPWEIKVPVHPAHPLHPAVEKDENSCQVCGTPNDFYPILYSCQHCEYLKLHLPCANSLKRAIIIKGSWGHVHSLFYYGAKSQKVFSKIMREGKRFSTCEACGESLVGMAFYHCLICGVNAHLKCVSIPHLIKSKCHIHPFTLKDYFVEDDSEKYYCDVCEEERSPEDHVYYCEECDGLFDAHIECVLKQVRQHL